jgi:hypothetical protein
LTGLRPPAAATWLCAVRRAFGTTALEGGEGGPVPITLVALTVNVYEMPLVNPNTTAVVELPLTTAWPEGVPVTV